MNPRRLIDPVRIVDTDEEPVHPKDQDPSGRIGGPGRRGVGPVGVRLQVPPEDRLPELFPNIAGVALMGRPGRRSWGRSVRRHFSFRILSTTGALEF